MNTGRLDSQPDHSPDHPPSVIIKAEWLDALQTTYEYHAQPGMFSPKGFQTAQEEAETIQKLFLLTQALLFAQDGKLRLSGNMRVIHIERDDKSLD